MDTQRFTRNPVEVEAVQVTPQNVEEVAKWCKGTYVETEYRLMGGAHKLGAIEMTKQGPKGDKTIKVLIGYWITRHKNIFKAWKLEQFQQVYTPVAGGFAEGDLVRATNESPFFGFEGKVADAHLVGVDFGARGMVVFQPEWLEKIDEMDSAQLMQNAGVEPTSEGLSMDPVKSVLDEMRTANRERIEAMEAENNKPRPQFVVGDLVKIIYADSEYVGQCGHIRKIHSDDAPLDAMVGFAAPIEGNEEHEATINFKFGDIELIEPADALNLQAELELVSLNDLRENLGMARVPELEGIAPDARALENYKIIQDGLDGMTPEEAEKLKAEVAQLQSVIGRTMDAVNSEMQPWEISGANPPMHDIAQGLMRGVEDPEVTKEMDAQPLEVGDLVETLVAHEFDGVDIPFGINGRVVVLGVDVDGDLYGVEVMFADGHYHSFRMGDVKKV